MTYTQIIYCICTNYLLYTNKLFTIYKQIGYCVQKLFAVYKQIVYCIQTNYLLYAHELFTVYTQVQRKRHIGNDIVVIIFQVWSTDRNVGGERS